MPEPLGLSKGFIAIFYGQVLSLTWPIREVCLEDFIAKPAGEMLSMATSIVKLMLLGSEKLILGFSVYVLYNAILAPVSYHPLR